MGFVNKITDLIVADGKTVAVVGNEFYANEAKKAHSDLADEKSADVVI